MHTVHVQRELDHPADAVWALLDDFAGTHVYHPVVAESASTNGIRSGVGAQRYCQMYDGGRVEERVTEHDANARRYSVEVTDHGPFPLTHMVVHIQVHSLSPTRSRVTYDAEFTPKFGPLGWVMGKLMMQNKFASMLGHVIDGAGEHLTTGRVIEKDGVLGAPVVAA